MVGERTGEEMIKACASPYNRLAVPEAGRERVAIHDLTLEGDGEEMAGVMMSEADRLETARRLAEVGVDRLAVLGNSPMPSPGDIRCAEKIVALGLPVRLDAFVKSREEIDIAARVGLSGVDILVWVNDRVLPSGMSGDDVIDRCGELVEHARARGLHTCLMGMDATRTRPEFLRRVISTFDPLCHEFTVGDSLGTISPYGMRHLMELVTGWTQKPIQVHLHNHTSVAVANALAATLGGATTIQTTVNGLGEFTGLVPLEEFAVAALIHLGVSTGVEIEGLKALSELVARASGVRPSIQKPVVGEAAFAVPETEEIQEAYWKLSQINRLEAGLTYPPRLVGNRCRMSIGRRCNRYTVLYHLARMSYSADDATADRIATSVREHMSGRKGYALMDEEEFEGLVRSGGFELEPFSDTAP